MVEGAIKELGGILEYQVNGPPKDQAIVVFDPIRTNIDVIKKAILEIGYDVGGIKED